MRFRLPLGLPDEGAEHRALVELMTEFMFAVGAKVLSQIGKRGGWADPAWTEDQIRERMAEAVLKGDPVDVAAFAAFLWNRSNP